MIDFFLFCGALLMITYGFVLYMSFLFMRREGREMREKQMPSPVVGAPMGYKEGDKPTDKMPGPPPPKKDPSIVLSTFPLDPEPSPPGPHVAMPPIPERGTAPPVRNHDNPELPPPFPTPPIPPEIVRIRDGDTEPIRATTSSTARIAQEVIAKAKAMGREIDTQKIEDLKIYFDRTRRKIAYLRILLEEIEAPFELIEKDFKFLLRDPNE